MDIWEQPRGVPDGTADRVEDLTFREVVRPFRRLLPIAIDPDRPSGTIALRRGRYRVDEHCSVASPPNRSALYLPRGG